MKNERYKEQSTSASDRITLNFITDIYSKDLVSETYEDGYGIIGEMADSWSLKPISIKAENSLVSPANFIPNDKSAKGLDNISHMSAIFLDFDNKQHKQTFTYMDFHKLFPDIMFVAHNSFSHNCYRIIIPSVITFPAEAYDMFWTHIYLTIDENYSNYGLDMTKRAANSFFYMPRKSTEAESFFHIQDGNMFDPRDWLEMELLFEDDYGDEYTYTELPVNEVTSSTAYKNALDRWHEMAGRDGYSNAEFFRFASVLKTIGMGFDDIKAELNNQYIYSHNPKKRKKQIDSIMITLFGK